MKVAVIGNGPLGLEIGLDFLREGADVRILGRGFPASKVHTLCEILSEDLWQGTWDIQGSMRTETLEFLGLESDSIQTPMDLWKKYYLGIISYLNDHGVFYDREVLRVGKRFLEPQEEIENHTRLFDLFRVIYSLNPTGMLEDQLKENPELSEKLKEDGNEAILSSLQNAIESFEDFDLIFDTRGPYVSPYPLGAGRMEALNESRLAEEGEILYGYEIWKEKSNLDELKTLTLYGSGKEAANIFFSLIPWLEKDNHVLNIVTPEKSAFQSFLSDPMVGGNLKEELRSLIRSEMESWRKSCEKTEEKLHTWRDLPSHEKMKIPQPAFPEPRLRLYEGYSIMAIDQLVDQDGIYLTLEIPEWRSSEKKEMVTLSQDKVIASAGYYPTKPFLSEEPGYFVACSLKDIPLIKSEVFKYFSRA